MATRIDWSVIQSNQAALSGQILDVNEKPIDLTQYTLSLVVKASATATDASGTTYAPTIASALLGKWTLDIPGSAFPTAEVLWYRLDVVDLSSNHVTAILGSLSVVAA